MTSSRLTRLSRSLPTISRRRFQYPFFFIIACLVIFHLNVSPLLFYYPGGLWDHGKLDTPRPNHQKIQEFQDNLPQHNFTLPFPEGKNGRYVRFSNQIAKLGWNNVFNEVLMNAHLAYESNRAYVFQDYMWKEEYYPWHIPLFSLDRNRRHPRTPLSAIISGPTAGGPWEGGDPHPRSVSDSYWDKVCPVHERRIINTRDVKSKLAGDAPGIEIFATWLKLLKDAPERCVEIKPAPRSEDNYPQTFDLWLWGCDRVLSLWESFSTSPTSRLLTTSPIVNSAIARNEYLFFPRGPRTSKPISRDPFDRMMAMHARRGDFKQACLNLATWNSTFYSWNLLPFLPDKFTPPAGGSWGQNTPENTEFYLKRCLPDTRAIVKKARDARADYMRGKDRPLDIMYLLTNDQSEWISELKEAFAKDGWNTIVTSNDLVLDSEQADVSMAVDMDIARRAAVFVGNGWSSFTSNIVHRRLVDKKEPISVRFW